MNQTKKFMKLLIIKWMMMTKKIFQWKNQKFNLLKNKKFKERMKEKIYI